MLIDHLAEIQQPAVATLAQVQDAGARLLRHGPEAHGRCTARARQAPRAPGKDALSGPPPHCRGWVRLI